MTLRFDLSDRAEAPDMILRSRQLLGEGLIGGLQLAEGSWAMADATSPEAAGQFLSLAETGPASLMIATPAAAADFIPELPPAGKRFLKGGRGPLSLAFHESAVDEGLLAALPEITRSLVHREEHLSLTPPSGPVTRRLLAGLPGPLLVCASESISTDESVYDVVLTDSSIGSPPALSMIRFAGAEWQLMHEGSLSITDLERTMAQQIIFVCTGNTCRSPMAEAMFRQLLAVRLGCSADELTEKGFDVASAGLAAMVGAPAAPESVQICAQQGVDLQCHASKPLTETLAEQADRLYTMTSGHREAILARYPHLRDRVEVLSRNGQDVSDPIGWGRDAYEQCYVEITENLRVLVDELTGTGRNDSDRREPGN